MQNFGKIKNAFSEILAEGIASNDENKKTLFKKYIKTLKESEILKTQFLVYENIENVIESDKFSANLIISENLDLMSKFNQKDILKENIKLMSISKEVSDRIKMSYDEKLSNLHESISKLVFLEKTPKTINEITNSRKDILDYIITNKEKTVSESYDVPNSMLSSILVEKYNEKYSTLNESEKEVIKTLIESDDNAKLDVYKKITRECIDLIDLKLNESDLETKDRLLRVKDKLLNTTITLDEDFLRNVSKIIELKATLNNNN
jgi:site-specific DNA-cytosine methylase